ncbi:hypothetical protein BK011_07800 [Tenericutes bacterium MZ-XQ]|nr:hypothetical protein BK011_07800 [Tenericutes bacterium MZ-XQ]
MYNLENLNDYEFEQLAKDIMQKKLNIKLHRFKKGQDGGIDICDNDFKIIIQVKHYFKSSWSNLKAALKLEIPKVEDLDPQDYYIFTSISLNPQNKKEILNLFPKYIKNISHIIDKIEIDDFLANSENEDILNKHFKLWFYSADLLNKMYQRHVFLDCEELLFDINKSVQRFVKTSSYNECLKKMSENNVLIITGSPGVGKSTISKMIVLNYIKKDYSVRYVSNNNVSDLKNSLSNNPEKREIILLDDFLGQHYLKIKESTSNEIKTLISYVENSSSKKIILNSRITILNEAKQSNIDFEKFIQEQKNNNYVIDLDKMSHLEKAKIFYNHLFFSNVPENHFKIIKKSSAYENIIKHKNYNPRIIEYVTNTYNLENIDADAYRPFIIDNLNNPDKVWDDEFRNRLTDEDRIFMHTLYSLTDSSIEEVILRKAFDKRIFKEGIVTNQNVFDDVYKRLGEALIKTTINNSKKTPYLEISVINPSVNDYLKKRIYSNLNEQKSIVKYANYIEQVNKIMTINDKERKMFFNHNELLLESFSNQTSYFYLKHLISLSVLDKNQEKNVQEAFEKICVKSSWLYEDLMVELLEKGYCDFYNLINLLLNNLESALRLFPLDSIKIIYKLLKQKQKDFSKDIEDTFATLFIESIQDYVLDEMNNELPIIVANCMLESNPTINPEYDYEEQYVEYFSSKIEDLINEEIEQKIISQIKEIPVYIENTSIDRGYIFYNIDIDGAIKAYIKEREEENRDYDNYDQQYAEKEEWDIIHELFSE